MTDTTPGKSLLTWRPPHLTTPWCQAPMTNVVTFPNASYRGRRRVCTCPTPTTVPSSKSNRVVPGGTAAVSHGATQTDDSIIAPSFSTNGTSNKCNPVSKDGGPTYNHDNSVLQNAPVSSAYTSTANKTYTVRHK